MAIECLKLMPAENVDLAGGLHLHYSLASCSGCDDL